MATNKIHEQLAFMRKQKGLTQEELAQIFGVSNQSVSKWESGACCPDISLLPDIANFFGVSIDSLFGRSPATYNFDEIVQNIKALFAQTPKTDCFDVAFRLSLYLHEGICTKGYKENIPWNANKQRKELGDFYRWGTTACNEPEGATIMKDSTVLVASHKCHHETEVNELMSIQSELQKYADIDRLMVFFALYELTREDFNLFVGIQEIINKSKMSEYKIQEAFKWLPIHSKELGDGNFGYRIEGSKMHIPAIILLFIEH